jgi:hypothetical protein
MLLKGTFRGRSRRKSNVGSAFNKIKEASESSLSSMFGDTRFLKRLLGKAGLQLQGKRGGQAELQLLAQLGDQDAIQLLADSGLDAKDHLGSSSLASLALTGDADAARLLEARGLSFNKKAPIFIVPQLQH